MVLSKAIWCIDFESDMYFALICVEVMVPSGHGTTWSFEVNEVNDLRNTLRYFFFAVAPSDAKLLA